MKDLTNDFGKLYHPAAALVFYQSEGNKTDTYVEHFDMDENGHPVNAHPLTVREAGLLVRSLKINRGKKKEIPFLKPEGLMGSHILYLDPYKGKAVWCTKAMQRNMHFTETLDIQGGIASVPPMLWVADRNRLRVFALRHNRRPVSGTRLYNAPFFNVYDNGQVCMGNVDVRIKKAASLGEFTEAWEGYFFNSYFSHLMQGHNPITGNCVSLWENLVRSQEPFPMEVLKRTNLTLQNVLL